MTDRQIDSAQVVLMRDRYEAQRTAYVTLCLLDATTAQRELLAPEYARDFDTLCMQPCFTRIAIDLPNRQLLLQTETAKLTRDGLRRAIGEFMIGIRKCPSNFAFENLTLCVNGRHHPHINSMGEMCLDQRLDVLTWITDGQLLRASLFLWQALNVSTGSQYENAAGWPLASEE